MKTRTGWTRFLVAGGLALGLAGCGDATGPDGARMNVVLTGSQSSAQAVMASIVASGSAGEVALEDVAAIELEITGIEAILQGESEEEEGSWVDLPLSESLVNPVDVLNLPEGGLQIAGGGLAPGTYSNLRIHFGNATISLVNDVTVGTQTFAAADNPHALFIPSGEQTGVKIPLFNVTVEGDADVVVLFDEDASVNTVAATGTGLLMEPVLGHAADEASGGKPAEGLA